MSEEYHHNKTFQWSYYFELSNDLTHRCFDIMYMYANDGFSSFHF